MSYTLHIHVTQEDIDQGIRVDCNRCPVALAISRVCPGADIHVGGAVIWDLGWNRAATSLPRPATQFISLFDQGFRPPPGNFELILTHEVVDYLARAAGLIC